MKDLLEVRDHQFKERPVSMDVVLSTSVQLGGFRDGVSGKSVLIMVAKQVKVKGEKGNLELVQDRDYND